MALWLVRAGKRGEYEHKFLEENRVYLTWNGLSHDLAALEDRDDVRALLQDVYPDASAGRIRNNASQVFAFSKGMGTDDWIVLPSKHRRSIHVARVKGHYTFAPDGDDPFFHYRDVDWVAQDVPRTNFDQDLLYSFGAYLTVCQVSRNDAEERVRRMAKSGWKSSSRPGIQQGANDDDPSDSVELDLAEAARDQLAKLVVARFQGHGMARLVDAILRATGYTTHLSPEGPDKGIDILAAPGPIGFSEPQICVQVKSGDSALDRPTLDQLIGVMQNVQASHGLLVSWGGFKSSIDKEVATQFFRVRLWDQGELIRQVLEHYDKLDEDIRAELPLRRIWIVAEAGE